MKIPIRGEYGGTESVESTDLEIAHMTETLPMGLAHDLRQTQTFVVINPAGHVNPVHSEERAKELMKAHAGHGWRYGLLVVAEQTELPR